MKYDGLRMVRILWLGVLLAHGCFGALGAMGALTAGESAMPPPVLAVMRQHCFSCHSGERAKAGVSFEQIAVDFSKPALVETWTNAMDRMHAGSMPPASVQARPTAAEITTVTQWIAAQLHAAAGSASRSTVVMRRLNQSEYANAILDLFHLDFSPNALGFPVDERRHGIDRMGSMLTISPSHLEIYAAAAQSVIDRALASATAPITKTHHREPDAWIHHDQEFSATSPQQARMRAAHLSEFKTEGSGYADIESDGNGVLIRSKGIVFQRVPIASEGDYLLRIRGYGVAHDGVSARVGIVYPRAGETSPTYVTADVLGSKQSPQVTSMRLRIGTSRSTGYDAGHIAIGIVNDAIPSEGSQWRKRVAKWLKPGQQPLPDPYAPQIYVDWIELEGPLPVSPENAPRHVLLPPPVAGQSADAYVESALRNFMTRAYRRPVTAADVNPVLALYQQAIHNGATRERGIAAAALSVLCSPHFLYRVEIPGADGTLSSISIANRLAWFLWNSPPDAKLIAEAQARDLRDPSVRSALAQRMLADARVQRFHTEFARTWFELGRVGQFAPDRTIFPAWSDHVQRSAIAETLAFYSEAFTSDADVAVFLNSDWTMLNETLARFYGIDGVIGDSVRRVALKPGDHRGGVLTHASVLSMTSDGTRQRPVHRGAWILENILGTPPRPPPPDVPEIEPNIPGGAVLSVRQRLSKHREQASCAGCHAAIDPYGLAFEQYDGIGRWRTSEIIAKPKDPSATTGNPRNKKSPGANTVSIPIDASGTLSDGRAFRDANELKRLLIADGVAMRRALARRMIMYAMGRELSVADDAALKELLTQWSATPTLRALALGIVTSPLFIAK